MMLGIFTLVKTALRLSCDDYNDEIIAICEAAEADLRNAGVNVPTQYEPLIARAITIYAKANFGADENSERYAKSYDALKCSLMLSGDYVGEGSVNG